MKKTATISVDFCFFFNPVEITISLLMPKICKISTKWQTGRKVLPVCILPILFDLRKNIYIFGTAFFSRQKFNFTEGFSLWFFQVFSEKEACQAQKLYIFSAIQLNLIDKTVKMSLLYLILKLCKPDNLHNY